MPPEQQKTSSRPNGLARATSKFENHGRGRVRVEELAIHRREHREIRADHIREGGVNQVPLPDRSMIRAIFCCDIIAPSPWEQVQPQLRSAPNAKGSRLDVGRRHVTTFVSSFRRTSLRNAVLASSSRHRKIVHSAKTLSVPTGALGTTGSSPTPRPQRSPTSVSTATSPSRSACPGQGRAGPRRESASTKVRKR